MTPYILHLSGHSCVGKSTISEALAQRLPGMYAISYDSLRWQLAGYDSDRDGPLVDDLVLGFFRIVCQRHIPILLNFYFEDETGYRKCRQEAEAQDYTFVDVELVAPLEIRLQRFRKRVEDAKHTGAKISITDEKTFLKNATKEFYIPEGTPRFDTAALGIEEIADRIVGHVQELVS